MAKKRTPTRMIVGSPLTPKMLKDLGAIEEFPPSQENFDPHGSFTNTYRIWTCHGFRETGNQNVGFIRVKRTHSESKYTFGLEIYQEVVEADGMLNVIEVNMICLNNPLSSPIKWFLFSRFLDPDGKIVNELGTKEEGEVRENIITVRIGQRTFERKVAGQFTSDWCLFEAVQRMKFDKETTLSFNMLEGLSLLKQGQQLSYCGAYPMNLSRKNGSLHRCDQLGDGILPYEYWLDNNHRLVAAVSMNKAYILDERAEKTIRQRVEQVRKSYRKTKSAVRK
jgi:hypothetical protein